MEEVSIGQHAFSTHLNLMRPTCLEAREKNRQ